MKSPSVSVQIVAVGGRHKHAATGEVPATFFGIITQLMKRLAIAALVLITIGLFTKHASTLLHFFQNRNFTIVAPTQQMLHGRKILSGKVTIAFANSTKSPYMNLETKKAVSCVWILLKVEVEPKEKNDINYATDQICVPYQSDTDPTTSDSFLVTYPGGDLEYSWRDEKDGSPWVGYHRAQNSRLELKKTGKNQYLLKYDYQGIKMEWSNTTFKAEVELDYSSPRKPIREDRSIELRLEN